MNYRSHLRKGKPQACMFSRWICFIMWTNYGAVLMPLKLTFLILIPKQDKPLYFNSFRIISCEIQFTNLLVKLFSLFSKMMWRILEFYKNKTNNCMGYPPLTLIYKVVNGWYVRAIIVIYERNQILSQSYFIDFFRLESQFN